MRRVVCKAFGAIDDLVIEDVPPPEATPGSVVVDVEAAGVNFVDALLVGGRYQVKPPLPFTPGGEFSGVISAVGAGVDGVAVGDRVLAVSMLGGFAEQVALPAAAVIPMPDSVPFDIAATLVQSYATAVFSLKHRTTVAPEEWVLVLGAGGGIGLASVDVAHGIGGRVIAAASSEQKRAAAVAVGAEEVVDYDREDLKSRVREITGGGADVVVDPVGGAYAERALRALRSGGRFLVVGFAAGDIPRIPLNLVLLANRSVIGVDWGGWSITHPDENRALVREILELAASGAIHPVTPAAWPLERAGEAISALAGREVSGKLVVVPSAS
jgi:NADPH:quinone reductase